MCVFAHLVLLTFASKTKAIQKTQRRRLGLIQKVVGTTSKWNTLLKAGEFLKNTIDGGGGGTRTRT